MTLRACRVWNSQTCRATPRPTPPSGPRILKDAHGNILADGDCVIQIKDLKLGVASVLKGGSKSKPLRLVDGDDEIDRNATGLKACFVKKA